MFDESELYTTSEPCSLCLATIVLSRIDKVHDGVSTQQSAQVMPDLPRPIMVGELRQQTGLPIERLKRPAEQTCDTEAVEVLAQWAHGR